MFNEVLQPLGDSERSTNNIEREVAKFCLQDMPLPLQPNFVLGVETTELYIQAGLQDRVIQVTL